MGRNSAATLLGVSLAGDTSQLIADSARAQRLAANHVAQIRAEQEKAIRQQAASPLRDALKVTESRARTLAATETFRAASEERLRAAETVQLETGVLLLKEWNAQSDSCPICSGYDGETVPVNTSFSAGSEPGSVHPSCRCWVEIIVEGRAAA